MRRFDTTDRDVALPVVDAFAVAIDTLAARGARVIVLPEKLVGITDAYRGEVEAVLADAAVRNRVTVVAGLNEIASPLKRNIALVFENFQAIHHSANRTYEIVAHPRTQQRREFQGIRGGTGRRSARHKMFLEIHDNRRTRRITRALV